MSRYLTKYVGTYRVKALYDLDTNDYPRDEYGNLDASFEDLYIPCKLNCTIKHAYQDNLSVYIPSLKRGRNIVKEIKDKYGDILYDIEETSEEIIFLFKANDIDKVADIMKASKSGSSTSPFSKKNLPKAKYSIPDKDMEKYKKLVKDIPFNEISKISKWYDKFDKEITKKQSKGYDVVFERKKAMIKQREFIHSLGMWTEFLEFIKKELTSSK